jgi:hypothetical protein
MHPLDTYFRATFLSGTLSLSSAYPTTQHGLMVCTTMLLLGWALACSLAVTEAIAVAFFSWAY